MASSGLPRRWYVEPSWKRVYASLGSTRRLVFSRSRSCSSFAVSLMRRTRRYRVGGARGETSLGAAASTRSRAPGKPIRVAMARLGAPSERSAATSERSAATLDRPSAASKRSSVAGHAPYTAMIGFAGVVGAPHRGADTTQRGGETLHGRPCRFAGRRGPVRGREGALRCGAETVRGRGGAPPCRREALPCPGEALQGRGEALPGRRDALRGRR